MSKRVLTCFKSYDIRGKIGVDINSEIVYLIGKAVVKHFKAKNIVVGYDARETSQQYFQSLTNAMIDCGSNVLSLGMSGTEEMYWAVTQYQACVGIEITASHNPINFNGLKIIKGGSQPLDAKQDWDKIRMHAENAFFEGSKKKGQLLDISNEARFKYVDKILGFVNAGSFGDLKVVVNAGNGAAGPTFDTIEDKIKKYGSKINFVKINHHPDHLFPNGIPNPSNTENHPFMKKTIIKNEADLGIAFDGDFDRCFFFDEFGEFVPGEYIVGLFSELFLDKENGATIVHDPRTIWNTQDIVKEKGGVAVQSPTGHSFMKKLMRDKNAIYGGEISGHHYFRDFAFCDSGMIPWLLIIEYLSNKKTSLSTWLAARKKKFESSGEINFNVKKPDLALRRVLKTFEKTGILDTTDGVSLSFETWRFNLRKSNTESLLRLNVETITGLHDIDKLVGKIKELIY